MEKDPRSRRIAGKKKHAREIATPYLMILPGFSIYFIFVLIPIVATVVLSFTNYDFFRSFDFIGLTNYRRMINDPIFLQSLRNTAFYSFFTIIPQIVIGLILATLLNSKLRGRQFFRVSFYIPYVTSFVAISMVWLLIYNTNFGILNWLLRQMGLPAQRWLFDLNLAMPSIIIMSIWKVVGYNMIIYLAGLQQIPSQLYEAAMIDGASSLRKFFSITVPLLKPTTFFLFVVCCVQSFSVFEQVNLMTDGGPMNATTTIVHQIYRRAFNELQMGYASSMAVVLLMITMIITLINFKYGQNVSTTDIG